MYKDFINASTFIQESSGHASIHSLDLKAWCHYMQDEAEAENVSTSDHQPFSITQLNIRLSDFSSSFLGRANF